MVIPPKGGKPAAEYPGDAIAGLSGGDVGRIRARGYELHFELDAVGRALVTLRDLDGRILRCIAASEAVEIASTPPGPALDRLLRS